jgi:cyclopropane-fatty-acyl-phospholipid synthase
MAVRAIAEHRFDAHRDEIEAILRGVYGNDTSVRMRRWRWYFLATSGLFGYAGGSEWGVSHYRMRASGGYGIRLNHDRVRPAN